jgi:hypothetical protein
MMMTVNLLRTRFGALLVHAKNILNWTVLVSIISLIQAQVLLVPALIVSTLLQQIQVVVR